MTKLLTYFIVSVVFSGILSVQAQVNGSRNFVASPMDDTTSSAQFLGNTEYGAEVGRGYGSTDNEQAWNIKFNGLLELYRNRKSSISFIFSNELISNPYNDIKFNPRGTIWCESINYFNKQKQFTLEVGLDHRCKHEVDNSDQPNEFLSTDGYVPTKRVIILTGMHAGIVSDNIEVSPRVSVRGVAKAELYASSSDTRVPNDNYSQTWSNAWGSLFIGTKMNIKVRENLIAYNRNWVSPMFFSHQNKMVQSNYRTEIGFRAIGKKAGIEMFSSFEHFFDDVAHASPQSSNVMSVGLRLSSSLFF